MGSSHGRGSSWGWSIDWNNSRARSGSAAAISVSIRSCNDKVSSPARKAASRRPGRRSASCGTATSLTGSLAFLAASNASSKKRLPLRALRNLAALGESNYGVGEQLRRSFTRQLDHVLRGHCCSADHQQDTQLSVHFRVARASKRFLPISSIAHIRS